MKSQESGLDFSCMIEGVRLEALPPVILAIAEQRELGAVLKTIIDTVARQPGVALARIWLHEPDESCPVCSSGGVSKGTNLHLRASAGTLLRAGSDWSHIDGE